MGHAVDRLEKTILINVPLLQACKRENSLAGLLALRGCHFEGPISILLLTGIMIKYNKVHHSIAEGTVHLC